jgi:hypothetical protein
MTDIVTILEAAPAVGTSSPSKTVSLQSANENGTDIATKASSSMPVASATADLLTNNKKRSISYSTQDDNGNIPSDIEELPTKKANTSMISSTPFKNPSALEAPVDGGLMNKVCY